MIQFKNTDIQKKFEDNGYAILDLLSPEETADLREYYLSCKKPHLAVTDKMHSTADTNNYDLIRKVDQRLKEVIVPRVNEHIDSYDYLLATYLVKEIGENSQTGFHQDPTMVSDNTAISANVWVALQDTNAQNGNLLVVKGSHRITEMLIVTPEFPVFFNSFRDKLAQFATPLSVKAGQAVVLNHKLVHGATENHTNEERVAAVMAIKSKRTDWCFHYLQPGSSFDKIEKYPLDFESFARLEKNNRPMPKEKSKYVAFEFPQLTFQQFTEFYDANFGNPSIVKKLIYKIKGVSNGY